MSDDEERQLLIPHLNVQDGSNSGCNIGDNAANMDSDDFSGACRCCSALRTHFLRLYEMTLRPFASCYAALRGCSNRCALRSGFTTVAAETWERGEAVGRGMRSPSRSSPGGVAFASLDVEFPVTRQRDAGGMPLRSAIQEKISDVNVVVRDDIQRSMKDGRMPIRTVEELATVLERSADFLPVRVEVVEEDLGGMANEFPHSSPRTAPRHLWLEVLGPIRSTPNAAVLGIVEDILLEDCVPECLCITCIRFADIIFSKDAFALTVSGTSRAESNDHLDLLPSLKCSSHAGTVMEESRERVAAFAKNILECCGSINTVHFTRCSFTPSDMGRGVRLPILRLRRLVFEKCPLSAAHIDAILRLSRAENRRNNDIRALECLEELQLCGSLTEESVDALLSYFHDDLLESKISLLSLCVPSLWLRVARSHPLLVRQPLLIVTGT